MGTPVEKAAAEPDLYKRGCSYRMPGERVDGDDVLAVRDAARAALRRAREERQPGLLEAVSYRLRGHSVVDPAKYRIQAKRPSGCAASTRSRRSARRLLEAGVLDDATAPRHRRGGRGAGRRGRRLRRRQPRPQPGSAVRHVYATPVANAPHELPGDPVMSAR